MSINVADFGGMLIVSLFAVTVLFALAVFLGYLWWVFSAGTRVEKELAEARRSLEKRSDALRDKIEDMLLSIDGADGENSIAEELAQINKALERIERVKS